MFKFNENTPKKIIFNSLNVAKLIYNNIIVWFEKVLKTVTGYPITLENSTGDDLVDYKIYGNSVQNGEPTPENSVEVESVGDYDSSKNKYIVPIKIEGKNMLDYISNLNASKNGLTSVINDDGTITTTGKPTSNWTQITSRIEITDILEDEETYTVSKMGTQSKIYLEVRAVNIETNEITYYSGSRTAKTFTVDKSTYKYDTSIITNTVNLWGTEELTITEGYMLEKGDTSTEFEPYYEPKIYNIYLDEPLRKIGDYTDYIDFENKKVVRAIGKLDLSSVSWRMPATNDTNAVFCNLVNTVICDFKSDTEKSLCTHFTWKTKASGYQNALNRGVGLYPYKDGNYKYIYFVTPLEIASSKDGWVRFVEGENMELYYILNEEKEEQIELPKIATNKGTNTTKINTNIEPSNMKVEYYAKEV